MHIVAAALGISAVVAASAAAFTVVKLVGGLYLVWLGVRTLRRGRSHSARLEPPSRSLRRLYLDGLVIDVLNPKVALFFLALLPQFVDPRRGPVVPQILVLGAIYIALGLVSDGSYAVIGAYAGRRITRARVTRHRGGVAEGLLLVGLGVSTLAIPHHDTRR